jgi:hypothetical protein
MKKVDFSKIEIVLIDGTKMKTDFQHGENGIGNQLYMTGRDIEACELGKKIYFADGEVELSDKEVQIVTNAVQGWSYTLRTAIIEAMKK